VTTQKEKKERERLIALREKGEVPIKKSAYPEKIKLGFFISTGVVAVIILLSCGMKLQQAKAIDNTSAANTTNTTVNQPIKVPEQKTSFENYLTNKDKYNGQEVTLSGRLGYEIQWSGAAGIHLQFIVDDYQNKVYLEKLTYSQRTLFVFNSTTTKKFNVTGTFKRTYTGASIDVENIGE